MLVIRLELHNANTGEVSELSRLIVANDGTGDRKVGNYVVKLGDPGMTDNKRIWTNWARAGTVKGHDRRFEDVWTLVRKALESLDL